MLENCHVCDSNALIIESENRPYVRCTGCDRRTGYFATRRIAAGVWNAQQRRYRRHGIIEGKWLTKGDVADMLTELRMLRKRGEHAAVFEEIRATLDERRRHGHSDEELVARWTGVIDDAIDGVDGTRRERLMLLAAAVFATIENMGEKEGAE